MRCVERFSLTPPVDVVALISRYAIFSEVEFPFPIDGLSLNIKHADKQSEVLVSASLPENRKRFTVAHELGHILIPWHVGSIIDDVAAGRSSATSRYRRREAEANRFAAELLMPRGWVSERLRNATDILSSIEEISAAAEVSYEAAALRAIKFAPKGFVLGRAQAGRLDRITRSPATRANLPSIGTRVDVNLIAPNDGFFSHLASDGQYCAWRVSDKEAIPQRPNNDSKTILNEILDELGLPRGNLNSSIHGIISFANSHVRDNLTREAIYAAALHNIGNRQENDRPEIKQIMSHPRFSEFVVARVYEFKL